MLERDDAIPLPPPATLTDAPGRLTEFAFAHSAPERTALLGAMVTEGSPRTADELADMTSLDPDVAREHLKVLVSAGLAASKRGWVSRRRTYVPTARDLELRFFAGERPSRERARTARLLQRDARRRERQKRRLERKERRIAKESRKG